ncbi:terminase large subunit [Turicimonas muris]|uniref:terminase large subunit n=1 Tax=Turicimonas muris TaxID=1796652 RepID=UPI002493EB0F|nr:terminase TerL endonuclease subunit [Turicimonas muris]
MPSLSKPNYFEISCRYARGVLSGRIPACSLVKKTCERQLDDLDRYGDGKRFIYDAEAGDRICWFIEHLTHVKGELAGQEIKLEPWQVFILHTTFSWKTTEGIRRFRRVYIEVPRGNGKSSLSSGVALFCLCGDREPGAEVYSFATTRDQAKIVFGDAKEMARQNPKLKRAFDLQVLATSLYVPKTNSYFQAKSAEGSTLDGLNTHLAVIDELHAHKTRAVYDVVETSLGKRRNSLMWVITTAGFDTAGICYEVRSFVKQILNKEAQDESQFGIIYGLDEGDDWTSEEALQKANPNWGVSVRPEIITSLQAKAIARPSAANNFKTKHLDVWCSAASSWMDMPAWNLCRRSIALSDFEGFDCYMGLDLGAKNDLTAKVLVFPVEENGRLNYYVFGTYYAPRAALLKSGNSQYDGWETLGYLKVTEGAVTDFNQIEANILEDCSRFRVKSVAYDPWQATQLATRLSDNDVPMVEYRNTVQNMSDPMKWLEALVQDKRLIHEGDPALTWMMGNVVAKRDFKDNVFPRKEVYENKIDGAVALIMALGLCVNEENAGAFQEYEADSEVPFFSW